MATRHGSSMAPFFSFYGGKWRDTPKYPGPVFDTIVEPFAGSAGYSVRHGRSRRVILGDADPVIVGVWSYLIRTSAEDILALPDVPVDGIVDDLDLHQEAKWLIGFWLNKGSATPGKSQSAWMRSGIRPGSFWGPRIRSDLSSQVDSIRHWEVYHASYEDLPFSGQATWFIDPPYQEAGRRYRCSADALDYERLAEWCRGRDGQMIVCENEGADWLPFRFIGDAKTSRETRSREAVWLGGVKDQGVLFS